MNQEKKFTLLGAPFDAGVNHDTTLGVDSVNGPKALRVHIKKLFAGYNIPLAFDDVGDIKADNSVDSMLPAIEARISLVLKENGRFAMFGGSHTITLGALRAVKKEKGDFSLVYIDAHPDIMPEPNIHYGSILFHAIKEGVLDPARILYIGIRQIEEEEEELIKKYNIKCIRGEEFTADTWRDSLEKFATTLPSPYVLSIDLDCLDPSYAPGISCPYPFGLTPRDLIFAAKRFCGKDLIGFDIVELAPKFDISDRTTRLAAVLLHEMTKASL